MTSKNIIVALTIALIGISLLFGCITTAPVCGNGVCETGETSLTCPADCGQVPIPGGSGSGSGIGCGSSIPVVSNNTSNVTTQDVTSGAAVSVPNCVASSQDDIYTAGFVTGVCADCQTKGLVGGNTDSCVNTLSSGQMQAVQSSTQLMKFYCTTEGWARKIVACPNGCLNGACAR